VCKHVDWCYKASREASSGILLMQDKKVMEKIKYVGESLLLPAPLAMSKMVSLVLLG
jgi:hypothetical protein